MKILLLGKYGEGDVYSGPVVFARCLYNSLLAGNCSVRFYDFFFKDYAGYSFFNRTFGFERLNEIPNAYRVGIVRLLILVFRERYDVIHISNNQRFTLYLMLIRFLIKSKFVVTVHGIVKDEVRLTFNNFRIKFIYRLNEWLYGKIMDVVIFPSTHLKKVFLENYMVRNLCEVIPNGVSPEFFNAYTAKKISLPVKIVFYSDAYDEINRNTEEIIEQIDKLNNMNLQLFIITSRQMQIKNNKKIIFVKPMQKSELTGFLEDKHIVIKSTAFDSFSMFIIECMAMGLVPVISDNVGVMELISHSVNGLIYEKEKPEQISSLIRMLVNDKSLFERLSVNAHITSAKLSWDKIASAYISLYSRIR